MDILWQLAWSGCEQVLRPIQHNEFTDSSARDTDRFKNVAITRQHARGQFERSFQSCQRKQTVAVSGGQIT